MKISKLSQKGVDLNLNRFYVYEHLKPNTGEVFYIGRGTKNRAYQTRSRNNHWTNIVKKYGLEVNIVYKNLTSSEANQKEVDLIDFYEKAALSVNSFRTAHLIICPTISVRHLF